MPIDIGGAFTISGASGTQALKIAGAVDAITVDTSGRTRYPNQIGFISSIGYSYGWAAQPAGWGTWNYQTATSYNKGGGFASGRFTAPVAGSYLFHFTCYHYRPSVGQGAYIHPEFWINGGETLLYRGPKAYWVPQTYAFDSEMYDIIYLNAGDYVEVHIYHSHAGQSGYLDYSLFSGFLVG